MSLKRRKISRLIIFLPYLFVTITLVVAGLFTITLTLNQAAEPEEQFYCGVTSEDFSDEIGLATNRVGKELFFNNCSTCHALNEVIVGPALANISERRSRDWLHNFITNSSKMIETNDPEATALFKKYNQTVMPSFDLSPAKIDSVLAYLQESQVVAIAN